MPAMPCCPCDSTTGLESRTPMGIKLGLTRAVSRCACCHNYGITDQIEDHEHFYLFQACECHQCDLFSVLPAESALKMDHGPHLNRHLTRGLMKSGAAPPRDRSFVKKMAIQGSVLRDLPREYAGRSSPKLFVSVLDSSTLEEATDNFSFRDFPQAPCPEQLVPTASDQASVSPSSEWRRKLEAAEALLILRASPQAPSGSISQLQP